MESPVTTSTRPYLLRALYEWCADNGLTPYLSVRVDETVKVPPEHVSNGEIVLNIGMDATSSLQLGNEFIEFKARFSGVARDIVVPVSRVMAIYARETGQGMAFSPEDEAALNPLSSDVEDGDTPVAHTAPALQLAVVENEGDDHPPEPPRQGGARPALKRVK